MVSPEGYRVGFTGPMLRGSGVEWDLLEKNNLMSVIRI